MNAWEPLRRARRPRIPRVRSFRGWSEFTSTSASAARSGLLMASLTRARPVGTRGAIAGVSATNYQSTWFIAILVVMTCGVVEIANADILARRGSPNASGYFWAGLVAIVAPGAVRLGVRSSRRVEHLLIATSICIALYLVKVLYAPSTFLFADEFIHYQNAHAAISSGQLFNANALLPETKGYPGLASVTSAVCSLTGLAIFPAGLLVIGCARFVLALAMFLFVENIVRSSRIAGLAVVLYAGNPNFLFSAPRTLMSNWRYRCSW